MKISIVLQIFAVIAAGGVRRCLVCEDKEDCTGESVECPDDKGLCAKEVEYNKLGDSVIVSVARRCLNHTEACDVSMSISTTRLTLESTRQCCDGDDCNSGSFQRPVIDNTPSGVVCRSCTSVGKEACTSEVRWECTGRQNDCFEFFGYMARPGDNLTSYFFTGCGSPEVFNKDFPFFVGTKVDKPFFLTNVTKEKD